MTSNPVWYQHRMDWLRMFVRDERHLIKLEWHKERVRALGDPEALQRAQAHCEEELRKLGAWETYLHACIAAELSSMPPQLVERPEDEAFIRMRRHLACMAAAQLEDDEPVTHRFCHFMLVVLMSMAMGPVANLPMYRDAYLSELRRKPEPQPKLLGDGDGRDDETGMGKPKPRKLKNRR